MKLPDHKAGLYLSHQEHKTSYEPVEEYLDFLDDAPEDWESPEAREEAIRTDSLWSLQWYPDTPVGFRQIHAPTLEGLLRYAEAQTADLKGGEQ